MQQFGSPFLKLYAFCLLLHQKAAHSLGCRGQRISRKCELVQPQQPRCCSSHHAARHNLPKLVLSHSDSPVSAAHHIFSYDGSCVFYLCTCMQIEHPLGEVQIRVMEARDINAVAVLLSRSFPSRDWQSVDNIRHDSRNVLLG
jgi:hypothetical protein